MVQDLVVIGLFIAAVIYVGRLVYKGFVAGPSCASGCGRCGIDFTKVRDIKKSGVTK